MIAISRRKGRKTERSTGRRSIVDQREIDGRGVTEGQDASLGGIVRHIQSNCFVQGIHIGDTGAISALSKHFCGIQRQDDGDREDGDDRDDDEEFDEGKGFTGKRHKRIIPPLIPPLQREKHEEQNQSELDALAAVELVTIIIMVSPGFL